ncbi:unnamed protein product [Phytophthora lilii]|uniref:Unnamed protein product n=1 Tax=Phytophthora lilii TaxID=2077276 RepID=A0A9W6U4E8_9STRA|nr:unnamed protein product [Phytophthora lilii]
MFLSSIEIIMKYCELTKYPKIYANTYWGRFDGKCDEEVISNRNEFTEEFGIKKQDMPKKLNMSIFVLRNGIYWNYIDHTECYFNGKSYVVITSPYGTYEDEDVFMRATGFSKYKKLYSQDANTYIKVVQKTPYNMSIGL